MTRPMHPSPATSTTFSCQLSNTLIAAPVDSVEAPGRGPTWLNPVGCGVMRVGVRGPLPPDAEDVAAMPLYLECRTIRVSLSQPLSPDLSGLIHVDKNHKEI